MMDDLNQAYSAYQNALGNLSNPKVCLTWIPTWIDLHRSYCYIVLTCV
jgi:hypothetical protein